ncbi:hypothetical protein TVAG_107600 [Trichomonas vaginalis G3]|uniref:Uncharacterized protein n=1 Tax=Trichomonas vaginalis (strain ATCC PRA-98 / G3) TaxID=412133 RepID=A2F0Q6_TRIV3|nr:uncharacterized protein TVAGG3_1090190 [Trichomonas vaginalis G3]EAY01501.1 hypothetical protein TVAG_107600 [Trichomonas vaginalis G3]KAI5482194.1 hypothetical protein TVAGG3_1090190 [Trichomonas vaginalis G3]|eukprot:XP_001314186.1 hypothetical protein [Trichomonas vaginalis G3]
MTSSPKRSSSSRSIDSIGSSISNIEHQFTKYKDHANILFKSFDSNGKQITLQSLLDKINLIKINLNQLNANSQQQSVHIPSQIKKLHADIKLETESLNLLIQDAISQIKSGNTDLKNKLAYVLAEQSNKLTLEQYQQYNTRIEADEKSLKSLDSSVEKYQKSVEKETDLISPEVANEVKNNIDDIKKNVSKIQFRNLELINPELDQSIENDIEKLSKSYYNSQVELQNLQQKLNTIENYSSLLNDRTAIIIRIRELKLEIKQFMDKIQKFSSKNSQNVEDILKSFRKIEKSITETQNKIDVECSNATETNVYNYFSELRKFMQEWKESLDAIGSQMSQVIPRTVITRSFADVERHENGIKEIIRKAQEDLERAKSRHPLNDSNIIPILNNIEQIQSSTTVLPSMARSVLKVSDGIVALRQEMSLLDSMSSEIESKIEKIRKIQNDSEKDENNSQKYTNRIDKITGYVNNLASSNSNFVDPTNQIKKFEQETDSIMLPLQNDINKASAPYISPENLTKIQNEIENCINEVQEESDSARLRINTIANKEYEKYLTQVTRNLDSIRYDTNSPILSQQIDEYKERSISKLNDFIQDKPMKNQLNSLNVNLKTMKDIFNTEIGKIKPKKTKSEKNNSKLDEKLKNETEKLLKTEEIFGLVSASVIHPYNDLKNTLTNLNNSFNTGIIGDEEKQRILPVMDIKNKPVLEIYPSRFDKVTKQILDLRENVEKMDSQVPQIDSDISTLSSMESAIKKLKNDRTLKNEKVHIPKGAEKLPEMNWTILKILDSQGIE